MMRRNHYHIDGRRCRLGWPRREALPYLPRSALSGVAVQLSLELSVVFRQPVRLRRVASDADHGLAGALGIVQHLKDMALNGAIGQGLKVLSLLDAHAPVRSIFQGAAPKLFFGWKGRLSPIAPLPPFATIPRMKHPIG